MKMARLICITETNLMSPSDSMLCFICNMNNVCTIVDLPVIACWRNGE